MSYCSGRLPTRYRGPNKSLRPGAVATSRLRPIPKNPCRASGGERPGNRTHQGSKVHLPRSTLPLLRSGCFGRELELSCLFPRHLPPNMLRPQNAPLRPVFPEPRGRYRRRHRARTCKGEGERIRYGKSRPANAGLALMIIRSWLRPGELAPVQ